jgi:hypothetical protein
MGKRKLSEFLERGAHTLHSFSTAALLGFWACFFLNLAINRWAASGFHKRRARMPVENEWKTAIGQMNAAELYL